MYRKNAAKPISGNKTVLRVILGFGVSIWLLHLTANRSENVASIIICFVHFHQVKR